MSKVELFSIMDTKQVDIHLSPGETITVLYGNTPLVKTEIKKEMLVTEAFTASCVIDGRFSIIGGVRE